MINYDDFTKENINKHNLNCLRIGASGSEKSNTILNLIKQQDGDDQSITDKIYLYVKDQYEADHQYLIKKREKMVLKI